LSLGLVKGNEYKLGIINVPHIVDVLSFHLKTGTEPASFIIRLSDRTGITLYNGSY